MAESQLMCMEDGHIGAKIPESKPEFYYSEEQRAAVEELLKNGDSAFKTRLQEDNTKDFLSAREVKLLVNTFKQYDLGDEDGKTAASPSRSEQDADSGVHSTYWPQMSDTEVPSLDIGWPSGGFFRGVTRVSVHTHPPKENGPHIKEVVRRLIQEATKVSGGGISSDNYCHTCHFIISVSPVPTFLKPGVVMTWLTIEMKTLLSGKL